MYSRVAVMIALAGFARLGAQDAGSTGTLAGVVRDSLGHGLPGVEVTILDRSERARTDSSGAFVVSSVPPGSYEVWFRRIGFASVQFDWTSHAGERVDIEVHLRVLPHTLDPVVVRATEDRTMSARSSVAGFVVDDAGARVPGVEIQLLGESRVATSRADGSFVFRHVPPGDVTLRARRMGYSPSVLRFRLADEDDREVTLRIRDLGTTLDPMVVSEQSGYGASAIVWKEFDIRQRFRTNASAVLEPLDLARFGSAPLDIVALTSAIAGAGDLGRLRYTITNILPNGWLIGDRQVGDVLTPENRGSSSPDDVCVLENVVKPRLVPLRTYTANEVEAVGYYPPAPPESDPSQSIYSRFVGVRACAPDLSSTHPAYWVIWLKGAR